MAVEARMNQDAHLGRMMNGEPELTTPQSPEFIRRFLSYVTADGFTVDAIVTRVERLKFAHIITGKTYSEILAGEQWLL
jgi:hypothetical protein